MADEIPASKPIDAEIVPVVPAVPPATPPRIYKPVPELSPEAAAKREHRIAVVKEGAEAAKRDKEFVQVALLKKKKYFYGRLSDRERKLIAVVLRTGNLTRAAEELGVSTGIISRFLKRPFVREYLAQMQERAADAADLTVEKLMHKMNSAVDGVTELTPSQISAAKIAASILAPKNAPTSVTIHAQQNNSFSGTSPFKDLDSRAMIKSIQANLAEMGALPPPAAPMPDELL